MSGLNGAPRRVLVAGNDHGGLNLLAPLLSRWAETGEIDAAFLGSAAARREMAFRVAGLRLAAWPETPFDAAADPREGVARLAERLRREGWQAVLTGTSLAAVVEKRLWRAAAEAGVPSLAYCDMWWGYRERFGDGDGECLPGTVLAVDARMADEIRKLAWSAPFRIVEVGSTLFERLAGQRAEAAGARDSGALRFVSEPASTAFPGAGIDEFEVAETLVATARASGIARSVVIRPHPAEPAEPWRRFVFAHAAMDVRLDVLPLDRTFADTWAAVGISSMLLAEYAAAGIPSASFVADAGDPAYLCLPFASLGIARLSNASELARWLKEAPAPGPGPAALDSHAGAADRVTAAVLAATERASSPRGSVPVVRS